MQSVVGAPAHFIGAQALFLAGKECKGAVSLNGTIVCWIQSSRWMYFYGSLLHNAPPAWAHSHAVPGSWEKGIVVPGMPKP